MTAYVVSEIEVTDPAGYERYRALVDPSFVGFNARFLVRGGSTDSFEGDPPKRIVIIAFDNIAEARRWYNSPSYTAAKLIRQDASIGRLYIVEG